MLRLRELVGLQDNSKSHIQLLAAASSTGVHFNCLVVLLGDSSFDCPLGRSRRRRGLSSGGRWLPQPGASARRPCISAS
eukprot:7379819-Prymnesium_polylepis.1